MDFTIMIVLAVGTLGPDDAALTLRALAPHPYNLVGTTEAPASGGDVSSNPSWTRRDLLEQEAP